VCGTEEDSLSDVFCFTFSVSPFLHLLFLGHGFDDFVALSNGFGLGIEFIPAHSQQQAVY
jgi:hypothetical protein